MRSGRVRSSKLSSVLIIVVAALHCLSATGASRVFDIASLQRIWLDGVDLQSLPCLTLNREIGNRIFSVDYSEKPNTIELARKYFPSVDKLSSDDPTCPFVLTFNIQRDDTHAVRLGSRISRIIIAIMVTERNGATGSLYYEGQTFKGTYKNVYLFTSEVAPLEALELGLKAFVTRQTERWQTLTLSLSI